MSTDAPRSRPIGDYALIGDLQTAALVSREGSIDWLCLPRFDSGACFAALLGGPEHGRWSLRPAGPIRHVERRYRPETLVLETELSTDEGTVRIVDCMPPRGRAADVVRIVEGVRGRVPMRMELAIRLDYGSIVPWVRRQDGRLVAVGGPDALYLDTRVQTRGEDLRTVADFTVGEGMSDTFVLTWVQSYEDPPEGVNAHKAVADTQAWWERWTGRCPYTGEWREAVVRSLVTLKALTFAPTGGIVAAATTSLPESIGGARNWDYRFCWLRDATLTLYSLLLSGYEDEARAWRDWLLRAAAGDPHRLQIMYGAAGERRLGEEELDWLPGYMGSRPVRIGNAAVSQMQLDVYGEVMDTLHQARRLGIDHSESAWALQRALMDALESDWRLPDAGIWEVRGELRQFTHSKVMAWTAMDRAVRGVEEFGLEGPVDRWRRVRAQIHEEVCREGYDVAKGSFTRSYDSSELDASLLMIPLVGFLAPDDPRVVGTVDAVARELCRDGFVLRYRTDGEGDADGLPGHEGAFLACSFWLADCLALMGRGEEARRLFERLLVVRNDVGLLSEEYDPAAGILLGNFPQAFSHVGLINTAYNLSPGAHPTDHRRDGCEGPGARD